MEVISLILLVLILSCSHSKGQTFGGITYTTTTNFLPVINGTNAYSTGSGTGTNTLTNVFSFFPPSKTVVIQGYQSNETFIGSMYLQVPANLITNIPGTSFSNLVYIGNFTNQFPNNVGNWATSTVPATVALPFPLVLGAIIQSNGVSAMNYSNSIFCP